MWQELNNSPLEKFERLLFDVIEFYKACIAKIQKTIASDDRYVVFEFMLDELAQAYTEMHALQLRLIALENEDLLCLLKEVQNSLDKNPGNPTSWLSSKKIELNSFTQTLDPACLSRLIDECLQNRKLIEIDNILDSAKLVDTQAYSNVKVEVARQIKSIEFNPQITKIEKLINDFEQAMAVLNNENANLLEAGRKYNDSEYILKSGKALVLKEVSKKLTAISQRLQRGEMIDWKVESAGFKQYVGSLKSAFVQARTGTHIKAVTQMLSEFADNHVAGLRL